MSLGGLSDTEIQVLEDRLLASVREYGGTAGNVSLMRELDWPDDQYWSVRNRLVDSGALILGRGRGGSVSVAKTDGSEQTVQTGPEANNVSEAELYEPLASVLNDPWAQDQRFRQHLVEITARQGRRETGGTWTRPDLVVAGLSTFVYLPERHFDVVTFEVKDWSGLDVTAVYEALAHHRASTRSYVLAHIPNVLLNGDNNTQSVKRIDEEARRHGIGFIVVGVPEAYDTWEERVEATYREPSPHALNDFISLQFSQGAKNELVQWFR